jgi:hypothetical protein
MYGENGAYDYMFAAIACVVVVAFCRRSLVLVTRQMRLAEIGSRRTQRAKAYIASQCVLAVAMAVSPRSWAPDRLGGDRPRTSPGFVLPPVSMVAEQLWRSIADGSLAGDHYQFRAGI